ncbi:MAG: hypothetical protein RLZ25_1426 [Pseudomonadota bacterium]|jgi:tight adherence protein B
MKAIDLLMLTGLIFSVVLTLILVFYAVFGPDGPKAHRRVSARINSARIKGAPSASGHVLQERYRVRLGFFDQWLLTLPNVRSYIRNQEFVLSIRRFRLWVLSSLGAALAYGIAAHQVAGDPLMVGIPSAAILSIPLVRMQMAMRKRLEECEAQIPDAMDILTRALRAGHSLPESINLVALELPEPLGGEFAVFFDELHRGVEFRRASQNFLDRVPSVALVAFFTSVMIQREVGGNLTENLKNISRVIRARFKFQRQVRILSAEGKLSVWVLSLIPVALFVFLWIFNPNYVDVLVTEAQGRDMVMVGFGLMAVGFVWTRQVTRIED